jgi:hypothetical protein
MHIRQTRVLLGLVSTLFCTVAFSSTGSDQTVDPAWFNVIGDSESVTPQPLLLAKNEPKVAVCVVLPSGNLKTKELTATQIANIKADHPQDLANEDGPCENENSPD